MHFTLWSWSAMPVTEKSALLFSSGCHLELVILENSEFFSPLMLSADSCSFLFLSFFFLSAFFVFGLIIYDWSVQTHLLLLLLWVLLLLRVCAGLRGCAQVCVCVCAGMCGYARVCVGMRRGAQCGRVCIGVHKCALVCAGVCKSVWMSASVCVGWILRISTGE